MICSENFLYEPNALLVINHKKKMRAHRFHIYIYSIGNVDDSEAVPLAGRLRTWPGHARLLLVLETLHSRSSPRNLRDWANVNAVVDGAFTCSMLRPPRGAKCGRSVRGGTPLTQPSRATGVVTILLRGRKSACGSFMRWGPARLAHRSIWGPVSLLFPLAVGLQYRPHRTPMQCRGRRIKDLRGGHGPASSYSVLH
jgi:hypothetical protein